MRKLLFLVAISLSLVAHAFNNVRDAFISENGEIFNSLSITARYEMLNKFDAHDGSGVMNNLQTDESRIAFLDYNLMVVNTSSAQRVEMLLIPKSKKDTLIAVIETVTTPTQDSRFSIYDKNWKRLNTDDYIDLPTPQDFFLPTMPRSLSEELIAEVSMIMINFNFDPTQMVAYCEFEKFFVGENFERYKPYLKDYLIYRVEKGKFKKYK